MSSMMPNNSNFPHSPDNGFDSTRGIFMHKGKTASGGDQEVRYSINGGETVTTEYGGVIPEGWTKFTSQRSDGSRWMDYQTIDTVGNTLYEVISDPQRNGILVCRFADLQLEPLGYGEKCRHYHTTLFFREGRCIEILLDLPEKALAFTEASPDWRVRVADFANSYDPEKYIGEEREVVEQIRDDVHAYYAKVKKGNENTSTEVMRGMVEELADQVMGWISLEPFGEVLRRYNFAAFVTDRFLHAYNAMLSTSEGLPVIVSDVAELLHLKQQIQMITDLEGQSALYHLSEERRDYLLYILVYGFTHRVKAFDNRPVQRAVIDILINADEDGETWVLKEALYENEALHSTYDKPRFTSRSILPSGIELQIERTQIDELDCTIRIGQAPGLHFSIFDKIRLDIFDEIAEEIQDGVPSQLEALASENIPFVQFDERQTEAIRVLTL